MPPERPAAVRPARADDLPTTARLHHAQLPDGFFARLGVGFLTAYHATFLKSPHAVAFVAGQDARSGFLVGTLTNRAHYRYVVKHFSPRLAARAALALLVRPRLAWLFLRTRALRYARWILRYPLQARRGVAGTGPPPDGPQPAAPMIAVLTHVAVAVPGQGNGTGRALVDAFLDAARRAGADEARLVTAAHGPAEQFYDRLGWTAGPVRNGSGGGPVREYHWPLRENATS